MTRDIVSGINIVVSRIANVTSFAVTCMGVVWEIIGISMRNVENPIADGDPPVSNRSCGGRGGVNEGG